MPKCLSRKRKTPLFKNIFYILKDLQGRFCLFKNNPCKVLEFTVFL